MWDPHPLETVQTGFVDLAAVEEIADLHQHKQIEDKSEVSRVDAVLLVSFFVYAAA